jgi:PqqD family protein of HPr-rel-A system
MVGQPGGSAASLLVGMDYVPRRTQDVLELDMGDGLILFDHGSSLVHHLNPSAGIVWRLAEGSASVEELAGDIARELGGDEEEVRHQVASLIAELEALGVVEDAGAQAAGVQPPRRRGT